MTAPPTTGRGGSWPTRPPVPVLLSLVAVILGINSSFGRLTAAQAPSAPITGLTNSAALAEAYDAILNAEFHRVDAELAVACVDVPAWCDVMHAVASWWQIALDPESTRHDKLFAEAVEHAIENSKRWTELEPARAEAWFALGAAYGARAQWRVEREERLAAARDGKRIKEALERALDLDPELHDAKFGIGLYSYYADVAPAALSWVRWLLLLPGGDRDEGLHQMLDAREHGTMIHGEADYQLHLIYLWYEDRAEEALRLIHSLQHRYPRNPLFTLIEAHIYDVYFHDRDASDVALRALIARAHAELVNEPALAIRRARAQLVRLHAQAKR